MANDIDQIGADVRRSLRHMHLIIGPLETDMMFAVNQYAKDRKSQFWSRMAIRLFTAYVEALIFQMKRTTLKVAPVVNVQFSEDESEILTEIRTTTDKAGNVVIKPKFLRLPDNVKMAFQLFARVHSCSFQLETSSSGYQDFLYFVEVRNRLTHPKEVFDIAVDDKCQQRCSSATNWFRNEYERLIEECQKQNPLPRGKM